MSPCQNPSQQATHPTDHDTLSCGPCQGSCFASRRPRNQVLLAHSLLGSAYYFSSACHAQCHKGKATISQTKFLDCKVNLPSWPYIRRSARFRSSAVFEQKCSVCAKVPSVAIMESTPCESPLFIWVIARPHAKQSLSLCLFATRGGNSHQLGQTERIVSEFCSFGEGGHFDNSKKPENYWPR